jgi:Acyl-CoA reductase (LuxC)
VSAELRARLEPLFAAARRIADPGDPLGQRARAELPAQTRLSPQNVELALTRCLESSVTDAELARFSARTPKSERSHVLLSANVFTAALRAIATGLVASPRVFVRASRREPKMAGFLAEAAPASFTLTDELRPAAGDQVFAYASDATLESLRRTFAPGTILHAHGSGFGAAAVDSRTLAPHDEVELAQALSYDVALFDQRGCLSPRVVWLQGDIDSAHGFTRAVARALAERDRDLPPGELDPEERADRERWRAALTYAGHVEPAGSGFVAVLDEPPLELPELGARSLLVLACADAAAAARPHAAKITTHAVSGSAEFSAQFSRILPKSRASAWGQVQRPPLDGPVDLRSLPELD